MKTLNIVFKPNPREVFSADIPKGEEKIIMTGVRTDKLQHLYQSNIFEVLTQAKLFPNPSVTDLINLALCVYTTDQVVSRDNYGFLGWSRHIKLHVPVKDLQKWSDLKNEFEELLSFLSGDKWELFFRQSAVGNTSKSSLKHDVDRVALFSGGLDSYIAAINLLESKRKICFVSHYKAGGTEKSVQEELIKKLSKKYGAERIISHQVYVQPNQSHTSATKEGTSRARSFLFLCLGLAFANAYKEDVDFVVPENGLISLNVPLTGTRLGSHSTRTTHPYFLQKLQGITQRIGIKNSIKNPYQFLTKGEMMVACKNIDFLFRTYQDTLSCSHGDISRYTGESPGVHCGYCVPCIIRQAAEHKSKIRKTKYVYLIKKSPPSPMTKTGSDLRAFQLGLERLKSMPDHTVMFDLLAAGPIPFSDKPELKTYLDLYLRGMKEVNDFLN
jgi:7-cyano-7-deazaguanine synthase in queuosine biosynthesis